ncbi:uncharacterized protein LY89DRAFT_314986 [Mollisia scopiformis]|uniref:Uncharacterized protein n=1 Tax=Mollisia scopiformis TaxID=149040 RepID=A0A132B9K1_MOLSC|nr:uncharacterized protein LY89DRAFT_314986 [Mollisia scopiformis]KUJ08933.1 hypothetical protein LY89DRAFT_314986 [Mollisia scopiformis]
MNPLIPLPALADPFYRNALARQALLPRTWPLAQCTTHGHGHCPTSCYPRDIHSHNHHMTSPFNSKHRCRSRGRDRDSCSRERSCSCHRCRSRERSCSRDRHAHSRCHSRERRSCSCPLSDRCSCSLETFRVKVAPDRRDLFRSDTSSDIIIPFGWQVVDIYDFIEQRAGMGRDFEVYIEMRDGTRIPLKSCSVTELYLLHKEGQVDGLVYERPLGLGMGVGLGVGGLLGRRGLGGLGLVD